MGNTRGGKTRYFAPGAVRALIAFVGWAALAVMTALYCVVLGLFAWIRLFRCETDSDMANSLLALIATGTGLSPVLFIGGGAFLVVTVCKSSQLDRRGWWRAVALVLLALPLAWLCIDAPPVENDYTIADITVDSPDAGPSSRVLLRYSRNAAADFQLNAPTVDSTSREAFTNALACAREIEQAWADIAPAREWVRQLDAFDVIADLLPGTRPEDWGRGIGVLDFRVLRRIGRVYWAHASLLAERGKPDEALRELVQFHSVSRKALSRASLLVHKMVWTAIVHGNLDTAERILRKAHGRRKEAAALILETFPPLTAGEVSMRSPLIGEYLGLVTELSGYRALEWIGLFGSVSDPAAVAGAFRPFEPFLYQRNRTRRILHGRLDQHITAAARCPPEGFEPLTTREREAFLPGIRNVVGGWLTWEWLEPSVLPAGQRCFELTVRSELLVVEAQRVLGRDSGLKDIYTGEPYPLDESGIPFGVGLDRKPGTADDIKLNDPLGR